MEVYWQVPSTWMGHGQPCTGLAQSKNIFVCLPTLTLRAYSDVGETVRKTLKVEGQKAYCFKGLYNAYKAIRWVSRFAT